MSTHFGLSHTIKPADRSPQPHSWVSTAAFVGVAAVVAMGIGQGLVSASNFLRYVSGNDESHFSITTINAVLNSPCLREIKVGDAFTAADSRNSYKIVITKAAPLSATTPTNILVDVSYSPLANAQQENFWPPITSVIWPKRPSDNRCDLKSFKIQLNEPKR